MRRLAGCGVVALVLLAATFPARAEEHGESPGKKEHEPSMFWEWANFALLAGGLGYVIRKNAGPYFAARSLAIRKGMADAEAASAASDAKAAEVDRRLANLQAEIEALHLAAKQEAEADAERIHRQAAAEMAKVQSHLAEEIAAAAKSAALDLRRYSAELALGLAREKIAARLGPDTDTRLVRDFVASLADASSGIGRN